MMKDRVKEIVIIFFALMFCFPARSNAQVGITARDIGSGLNIVFDSGEENFTRDQKEIIIDTLTAAERKIRRLLPKLPKDITVTFSLTDEKFDLNGGINGRAERNSPAEVAIEVSQTYPGGVSEVLKTTLTSVIYHEFHHLSRGWAIKDNKYSTEIYVAAVNEGLAVVFSEIYAGVFLPWNAYSDEADSWVKEILALPENSNYREWMYLHPDGRIGIGYKAGNFIVRKAMDNSGKNILELSELSPKKILKLAGYKL